MAESAISSLLTAITPIIREEFNLLGGVRVEIEFIRDEFKQMKVLLEKAGAKEDTDPQFEEWVRQVRETAYDAGDVLEEFILRLGHRHGGGFSGFLSRSSRFVKTIFVRHRIASQIQRIKLKVDQISLRQERYAHFNDVLASSSSNTVPTGAKHDSRQDALLLRENEIVGISRTKTELVSWLVEKKIQETRVLSVCGMGGLGKTTLVKKIYDDVHLVKHFEAHAWITVSKSFQIKELLKETIKKLYSEIVSKVPDKLEENEPTDLVNCVSDFLQRKRYVIVLDDIWDNHAWESLKYAFPNNNIGSRVILTTRNTSLALFARSGKVHNLLPLPIDESRTLFCRKVFQGDSCPSSLEETTETILKKCNGLPLAIVAIGGLLATKGQRIDEWDKISRGLGAELTKEGNLANLDSVLSLSYFDLPCHLRLCFLYLSIFPEDYSIDHWHLIRLWIAEGFVLSTQRQTAEEIAESYLTELTDRSLILIKYVGKNGRAIKYHIHDIWRELIISRSNKHDLVTVYDAEQHNSPCRVRRLSIHYKMDNWQEFKDRATHVHSLLMFGSIDLKSTSSLFNSLKDGAKLLKVLDLRKQGLRTFPRQIGRLLHLKYLSLRKNPLREIPKSIGDLQMLETLDLKKTRVCELPEEILKLHRLRHLLVGTNNRGYIFESRGFKVLKGMEKLVNLRRVSIIELNQSNNDDILRSISKLTRLRKLHIKGLRGRDGKELCSTLEKLTELRSLHIGTTISITTRHEIIDLEPLTSPPKFLQTLHVRARMEKLPQWIASLLNLSTLILTSTRFMKDPLLQLQDLPNLTYLEFDKEAYKGEALCFKAGTFKQLTTLLLGDLHRLKRVSVMKGAMPHLEELRLSNCRWMEEIPSGIETLPSLAFLSFDFMSFELTSKLIEDLENGNAYEIAHVPIVRVDGVDHIKS